MLIAALAAATRLFRRARFPTGDARRCVIETVAGAFTLGVQMAAPFLVFGLVLYGAAGVVSRLMPQLQIFFLAMPLNILAGFVLLVLLMGAMMIWFLDVLRDAHDALPRLRRAMADDRDDSQRTEEPTQKRLADAREKGDVAKSREIATLVDARPRRPSSSRCGRRHGAASSPR